MGGRAGNQIRIIGGQWRGRRLSFPTAAGLRPTSDRMRETLFNWLAPVLPGASCLDLFAGSGALGFEAASRGAARVVMNDRECEVAEALRAARAVLDAHQVEIYSLDMADCLARCDETFDIVFLDPPFARPELLDAALDRLVGMQRLRDGALIYVEQPRTRAADPLPAGCRLHRRKQAGAVDYRLYRCGAG